MPAVTEVNTYVLVGWSGGYNTEDYAHLQAPNEFDACDFNVGPRGEATVRGGLDRLASFDSWTGSPAEYRLASLFAYTPDAGVSKYLIGVGTTGLVWATNQGPGSTIGACLSASGQVDVGSAGASPAAATLGSYFVIVGEDGDPYYWSGSGNWVKIADTTLDDSGTSSSWEFPSCSTICSGWSRMWAAGNDTYPSRLYWSGALGTLKEDSADAAGPWNWPSTNWVDVNPEDGGEITRIFPFGQSVIIFKNNSIYALVGAGDPASARLYPIHGNVGCTLPGTAAESAGRLFWATDDGVYQYDGDAVTRIDAKVRTLMGELASGTYAKWASGYTLSERYHLFYPQAEYGTEAYHFVYDTEDNHWEYHTDGGWGAALFGEQAYVSRWGGIYRLGYNSGFDEICSAAGTLDPAVTIPCYLKTAWLPPPESRTGAQYRIRRLSLYMHRPAVSGDLTCRYRVHLYTDYNESAKTVGFVVDLDELEEQAEGYTISLPGYPGLVDSFRIVVQPEGDNGEEAIGINGMAILMSERGKKHGPYPSAPAGITADP